MNTSCLLDILVGKHKVTLNSMSSDTVALTDKMISIVATTNVEVRMEIVFDEKNNFGMHSLV